eukprot:1214643-Prymnesium_polylepis.1
MCPAASGPADRACSSAVRPPPAHDPRTGDTSFLCSPPSLHRSRDLTGGDDRTPMTNDGDSASRCT